VRVRRERGRRGRLRGHPDTRSGRRNIEGSRLDGRCVEGGGRGSRSETDRGGLRKRPDAGIWTRAYLRALATPCIILLPCLVWCTLAGAA
jgi:hypothetical protein